MLGPKRIVRHSLGGAGSGGVKMKFDHSVGEMQEIEMTDMSKITKSHYKRQGLGGYEDEEESLDNSQGRIE